jgi:hypothetical protein
MKKRQRACFESAQHWQLNIASEILLNEAPNMNVPIPYSSSAHDCALCGIYYGDGNEQCRDCPLEEIGECCLLTISGKPSLYTYATEESWPEISAATALCHTLFNLVRTN